MLSLDKQNAINMQLLGGIWILRTFPAIVIGLDIKWLHRGALLIGWAVAMIYRTWKAYGEDETATIDYFADQDDPKVAALGPDPLAEENVGEHGPVVPSGVGL